MRTAFISDIHSNLEALNAIFEDIDHSSIDEIVCLGDIVGYGANPNECIDLVRDRCPIIVLGNHDAAILDDAVLQNFNPNARFAIEWTRTHLTKESYNLLESLPIRIVSNDKTYVHSTPFEPKKFHYITSVEDAALNFRHFNTRFCFIGHSHIPVIFMNDVGNKVKIAKEFHISYEGLENQQFLINVGSSGQPRDRNPKVSYGILDTDVKTFEIRRIVYDLQTCQQKIKDAEFPAFLYKRLAEGK